MIFASHSGRRRRRRAGHGAHGRGGHGPPALQRLRRRRAPPPPLQGPKGSCRRSPAKQALVVSGHGDSSEPCIPGNLQTKGRLLRIARPLIAAYCGAYCEEPPVAAKGPLRITTLACRDAGKFLSGSRSAIRLPISGEARPRRNDVSPYNEGSLLLARPLIARNRLWRRRGLWRLLLVVILVGFCPGLGAAPPRRGGATYVHAGPFRCAKRRAPYGHAL